MTTLIALLILFCFIAVAVYLIKLIPSVPPELEIVRTIGIILVVLWGLMELFKLHY